MKRLGLTFALIVFALPAFARARAERPVASRHRAATVIRQVSSDAGTAWLRLERRIRDRFELLEQLMYRVNDPGWERTRTQ